MEKSTIKKIEVERQSIEFYCDCCGKYIATSEECYDGYINNEVGKEYNWYSRIFYDYKLDKCLCEECSEKELARIKLAVKEFAESLGFKKKR